MGAFLPVLRQAAGSNLLCQRASQQNRISGGWRVWKELRAANAPRSLHVIGPHRILAPLRPTPFSCVIHTYSRCALGFLLTSCETSNLPSLITFHYTNYHHFEHDSWKGFKNSNLIVCIYSHHLKAGPSPRREIVCTVSVACESLTWRPALVLESSGCWPSTLSWVLGCPRHIQQSSQFLCAV